MALFLHRILLLLIILLGIEETLWWSAGFGILSLNHCRKSSFLLHRSWYFEWITKTVWIIWWCCDLHMQQQFYSFSQGTNDFSLYFTKFTKFLDELLPLQFIPDYTCEAAITINKFFEDQQLIQLLMGLNESYKSS